MRTKVVQLVDGLHDLEIEVRRLRRQLEVNVCPEESKVLFSDAHNKAEGLKLLDQAASYVEEARTWIQDIAKPPERKRGRP